MKLFGNKVSPKTQRELLMRLIFIVISGTIIVRFAFRTVAWFSSSFTNTVTGGSVIVSVGNCDIMVIRTVEYDRTSGAPPKEIYAGTSDLKDYLADSGYPSDINATDNTHNAVAFEMKNDLVMTRDGVSTKHLMPGAYGKVDFYILPKSRREEPEAEYNFTLLLKGYKYEPVDPEDDLTPVISEHNDAALEGILKGHLLFFRGHDDVTGKYSTLIEEEFTYTANNVDWDPNINSTGIGGYHVQFYWLWPITYDEIVNDDGVNDKYPTDLYGAEGYVSTHPEYFFKCNASTAASKTQEELSDMYNDCDQDIGDNYKFLVLYMTAK